MLNRRKYTVLFIASVAAIITFFHFNKRLTMPLKTPSLIPILIAELEDSTRNSKSLNFVRGPEKIVESSGQEPTRCNKDEDLQGDFHIDNTTSKIVTTLAEGSEEPPRYKQLYKYLRNDANVSVDKTILFWTESIFPTWAMPKGSFDEGYLKTTSCLFSNCIFTKNKTYLASPEDYDAMVFHIAERHRNVTAIPEIRRPGQVYFLLSKE